MWTYKISRGELSNGEITFLGYSGAFGVGQNSIAHIHLACIGPIPLGTWRIGTPIDSPRMGPLSIPLVACGGTETFGRNGFYAHGDNAAHPGHSSDGCIIASHAARVALAKSVGQNIQVIP